MSFLRKPESCDHLELRNHWTQVFTGVTTFVVDLKESGDIFFNGEGIGGLRPDEHLLKGISMIPEGRRLFPSMTVIENLEMGAFPGNGGNIRTEI